jgi:hypothetical protein
VPWFKRFVACLSQRRLGFEPESVCIEFVVDKWHWDRFFYQLFAFPLSISFHHGSTCSYVTWNINITPTVDRSSEISFYPIDMKNNMNEVHLGSTKGWKM